MSNPKFNNFLSLSNYESIYYNSNTIASSFEHNRYEKEKNLLYQCNEFIQLLKNNCSEEQQQILHQNIPDFNFNNKLQIEQLILLKYTASTIKEKIIDFIAKLPKQDIHILESNYQNNFTYLNDVFFLAKIQEDIKSIDIEIDSQAKNDKIESTFTQLIQHSHYQLARKIIKKVAFSDAKDEICSKCFKALMKSHHTQEALEAYYFISDNNLKTQLKNNYPSAFTAAI